MNTTSLPAIAMAALLLASAAKAGDVVQIDVAELLNTRPINAVVNGLLVVQSSDLDGVAGLSTRAAALTLQTDDPHALPDDGKIPATDNHPEIILPYGAGSDDGRRGQVRKSAGDDSFTITVTDGNYTRLFLMLASTEGTCDIGVDLKYKDNSVETKSFTVPNWTDDLKPDDKNICYIVPGMSKWSTTRMLKPDHQNIFGIDIQPNPDKVLVKIRVRKGNKGVLAFFGATGEQRTAAVLGTPP